MNYRDSSLCWSRQSAPNGAVKLSGLQGYCVEAGRGSYSKADGPEHGWARSLPSRRYAHIPFVHIDFGPISARLGVRLVALPFMERGAKAASRLFFVPHLSRH